MGKDIGMSMPIGETSRGLPSPVLFDPHYPIRLNQSPVTLITGSPGSGKTVASLLLAAHSALLNKTTVILDPKGDFLALKLLQDEREIENVKVWSIFDDVDKGTVSEDNLGILDPTCLTDDPKENAALTMQTIKTLVTKMSAKQRSALIPIVQDVANSRAPSMNEIKMILSTNRDPEINTLSKELDLALSMPAGKLLVSNTMTKNKLTLNEGVIVASLMGLSLPSNQKSQSSYSEMERLSVSIIQLVTQLVLNVMTKVPKTVNKTLFIDEAWAVFNNEHGRKMIDEVALLGRSLNMAFILATQSPAHIQNADGKTSLDNTISTRIAFKNRSEDDNRITIDSMNLPRNAGFEGLLKILQTGQCLMKDVQGQFAFVDILLPEGWLKIFDTTPKPE